MSGILFFKVFLVMSCLQVTTTGKVTWLVRFLNCCVYGTFGTLHIVLCSPDFPMLLLECVRDVLYVSCHRSYFFIQLNQSSVLLPQILAQMLCERSAFKVAQ